MKFPLFFLLALSITAPQAYTQLNFDDWRFVEDAQFNFADWRCVEDAGNYTTNSKYYNNLLGLLSHLPNLTNEVSFSGFGNTFLGDGIDKVHMLYSCRGDLNSQECHDCVKQASHEILERCPSQKESILWFEECMVRYAIRATFSLEEESPYSWGYTTTLSDDSIPNLAQIVAQNIDRLIEKAAYHKDTRGYTTGQVDIAPLGHVYILVQCTPDILGSRCEKCLRAALKSVAEYGGMSVSTPLMILYPSCHIRYDRSSVVLNGATYSPISQSLPVLASTPPGSLPPTPPNTGGSTTGIKIRSYWDFMIRSLALWL